MKQCINCHMDIPDDASFCFYCARSQQEKQQAYVPEPKSRSMIMASVIALTLAAAVAVIAFLTTDHTLDNNSAEIIWKHNDAVWHILLRNAANDDFHWTTPQDIYSRTVREDTQATIPLQLYAYDEADGHSVAEEFTAELDSSKITATGGKGSSPLECSRPEYNPAFPYAVMVSDIVYEAGCGSSEVIWTLNIKDGTTLILYEKVEIDVLPRVEYSWESTPLSTSEELQALLDEIKKNYDGEDIVINLAPEVYSGDISTQGMSVSLTGTGQRTVFEGQVYYDCGKRFAPNISGLTFRGRRSGITTSSGVFIENCVFEECECAVRGMEGSWPIIYGSTFDSCETGVHINSTDCISRSALFHGNSFLNNRTAVLLENIPFEGNLYFIDFTFENNETDIDNRTGCEILFSFD